MIDRRVNRTIKVRSERRNYEKKKDATYLTLNKDEV